jgi:hypothetical protein
LEIWIKLAWLLLALIHLSPAAVFFVPDLMVRLYGLPPDGTVGLLLIHRSALFLALLFGALFAMFQPEARRVMTLIFAVSMLSYLFVYVRAGMPGGALRTIALADLMGILPLAFVCLAAWGALINSKS